MLGAHNLKKYNIYSLKMLDIISYGGHLSEALKNLVAERGCNLTLEYRLFDDPVENEEKKSFELWLTHIISHYDDLADYTLFLSNTIVADSKFRDETQFWMVLEAEPSLFCDKTRWCKILRCDENGVPHHPGLSIKTWFMKLFPNTIPPAVFEFVQGAPRIMSKEKIRKRPIEFYKVILDALKKGMVSHHVLERLWGYV